MGAIIARLRKEKSTYAVLEKLEYDIKLIEDYGQSTKKQRRSIITNIVYSSMGLYFVSAALVYQYFLPKTWPERIFYVVTPLVGFPLVIILFKKLIGWYYDRKISKNASKLMALREKKRKILDEVMKTQTYEQALKILERFDERPVTKKIVPISSSASPAPVVNSTKSLTSAVKTQSVTNSPFIKKGNTSLSMSLTSNQLALPSPPSLNKTLPRPILSPNRSFLDKMVDYIIGDGPTGRYALICTQCFNHNGMALEEEFEYLAFRCAFCATFNPARKQRPIAPALSSDESKEESKSEGSDDENTDDCKPLEESGNSNKSENESHDEIDK